VVPINSGIRTVADLRGKEYPTGFKASPLFALVMEGFLVNSGVSLDEVKKVPVVAVTQHWDFFRQGKIVAATGVVGAGLVQELNASVSGGIRFLSMERSPAALTRVSKLLPGIEILPVKPNPNFVGVEGPINVLAYDYMLWTHKGMNPDTVYKVVKALYDNERTLHQASPIWRSHRSARMAKDHGLAYHPGAEKFYQEAGVWKR
jgi:TRAP transporter TAXI family solute receptor